MVKQAQTKENTMQVHDRATYGRFAGKLDDLFHEWAEADAAADAESYGDDSLNEAAANLWDAYEEARDVMKEGTALLNKLCEYRRVQ